MDTLPRIRRARASLPRPQAARFKPNLHPSVWHYLARQLRGAPLLPRMHTLYWTLSSDPYDATLLTILPSTAVTLSLDFGNKYSEDSDSDDDSDNSDDEALDEDSEATDDDTPQHLGAPAKREEATTCMLRAVCSDTPRISDLTICKCMRPGPLLASILPALPSLRRLDLSESYPVDVATLRVLSCVATLETLENVPIKNARVDGTFTGFPALKTLGVVGAAEETEQLLAAVTSPLTCVAIKSRRVAMWEAAFPHMESPMSTVTTFELDILASDPDPYDSDDTALFGREDADLAQLLTPLAAPLAQLQVLRLSFRNVKSWYGIKQLTQLAQMFPCLTHFSLAARALWSVGYPTLAAVAMFARHCPRLETLLLPQLFIVSRDIAAIRDPFLPVQHALHTLCVLDMAQFRFEARDADSEWLGSTLAAMFPSLDVQACMEPPYSWLHIDRVRTWDDGSVPRVRAERVREWKEGSAQWRDMLSVIGRLRSGRQ